MKKRNISSHEAEYWYYKYRQCQERMRQQRDYYEREQQRIIDQMLYGTAHYFNNYLSITGGNADLLKMKMDRGEDKKELEGRISEIKSAVQRGAFLVKSLIVFFSIRTIPLDVVKIHDVAWKTKELLEEFEECRNIRIEFNFRAERDEVKGSFSKLVDIFSAIVKNACEATEKEEGVVRISTDTVNLDEEVCDNQFWELSPGDYIIVAFRDFGKGIEKKFIDRVFDPFYSTKDSYDRVGGLGLSIAKGLVRNHFGAIRINSEPDKGTVCRVYLPLV